MRAPPFTFYEFFAGGGMARLGLGEAWRCLFANDVDPAKADAYRANVGGEHLHVGDVWDVDPAQLPGRADLAWASSPCQDLSLAGKRAGLSGARSSAFWGFWRLIEALNTQGRAPRTIVIENVTGLLTSHAGADFTALCRALHEAGYRFGALELDAALYLPQSRPRLFVVAARRPPAPGLAGGGPEPPAHSRRIVDAHGRLPPEIASSWVWWRMPAPRGRNATLASLLEPDAEVAWHTTEQTGRLVAQLSRLHQRRLIAACLMGERVVAPLFRRMRTENGVSVQRGELRLDGLAGCLRTPKGGSSRQFIVVAEPGGVRSRPMTPREAARLMGLPESYRLPKAATTALHVVGDGVAVPVVRHVEAALLRPLLTHASAIAAE